MRERVGDLLKETIGGIIIHGVNIQGKFNAGFAKKLRSKYPQVYFDYIAAVEKMALLGQVCYTQATDRLVIASIFTQEHYGRDPDTRYISYDAFDVGLEEVVRYRRWLQRTENDLALQEGRLAKEIHMSMPTIGGGLGNGSWAVIKAIAMSVEQRHGVEFNVVHFNG